MLLGRHWDTPVAHEVNDFLQLVVGLGVQSTLGVHDPQLPWLQYILVPPQVVPSPAFVQAPAPSHVPVWQLAAVAPQAESGAPGFLDTQAVPALLQP